MSRVRGMVRESRGIGAGSAMMMLIIVLVKVVSGEFQLW